MIQTIRAVEDQIMAPQATPNAKLQAQPATYLLEQQGKEHPPTALFTADTINRLLTAAVVNRRFCRQLLQNPCAAIAAGYHKENFAFSTDELAILSSIRVQTLAEFAQIVAQSR